MTALPESIREKIGQEPYQTDAIGMSASTILLFSDKVLKIQPNCPEAHREHRMLLWLQGKVPVPEVLGWEESEGRTFLLMSRLAGNMACSQKYLSDPYALTRMLAGGLKRLWQVDISDCPVDQSPQNKLRAAQRQVELGLVDMENVEPDTFGEKGFQNPQALLLWLQTHVPDYEPVLSHGDHCLPNVFFEEDGTVSYLDLGRGGVGDKWCDIALCWRSLRDNVNGRYCGEVHGDFDPDHLFQALELAPDWEKIRYYLLMDELF